MTADEQIEIVLFDIGGVLARFAGLEVLRELTGAASELDVSARWLMSPWVRRFESGGCTDEEFSAGIVAEWELPYTAEEFLRDLPDLARPAVRRVASSCSRRPAGTSASAASATPTRCSGAG